MLINFSNLLTTEEIQQVHTAIQELPPTSSYPHELGRLNIEDTETPHTLTERLTSLVNDVISPPEPLEMVWPPLIVEYAKQYGDPHLPPHFDGDSTDFIIDYQLESNTTWPIGVDKSIHELKDNDAVGFNPNKNIHWRPEKTFLPGEYVKMMFFRFKNPNNPSDNSHLPHHPEDPIFSEVAAYRASYGEI